MPAPRTTAALRVAPRLALLLPLATAGCIGPFAPPRVLEPGLRVEIEADVATPGAAIEVDEKTLADGLDVTAPIELLADGAPALLGVRLSLSKSVDWEDADKETIEPFPLTAGTWVRARGSERDGLFHVRLLRQAAPRERIEVEGVVSAVEGDPAAPSRLALAPFAFALAPGADVTVAPDSTRWRQFFEQGPLARRAAKEQKFVPFTLAIGDSIRLGGQLAGEMALERDFDLDRARERDAVKSGATAELHGLWRFAGDAFLLASIEQSAEHDRVERRGSEHDHGTRPKEAYLFLPDVGVDGLHLQLGRQDLDERREWLYDETVDGVRAYLELGRLALEGSATVMPHALADDLDFAQNLIANATWRASDEWFLDAYVIDRRSRDLDDFSPLHYGLRSYAKPDTGLAHWLELARVDGLAEGRRLRGWAIDGGATFVADLPFEPSLTAGYAIGSGDRSTSGDDATFRQTGLQDNNGKWNGVTSFRYYGEVLDPELSNLEVATLGFGVRPWRQFSVDLVAHAYRQRVAIADALRAEIDETTDGVHRALGRELDLIVGWRTRYVTSEVVAGLFDPGRAFVNDDRAWLIAAQVRCKF